MQRSAPATGTMPSAGSGRLVAVALAVAVADGPGPSEAPIVIEQPEAVRTAAPSSAARNARRR
ncbi:hypothetical protein [Kitasatospora camelliae]|uniref:Uncharacterized protein n=1 Tax=Kitasatospora camelliae TaxID=3156397 RepID=A0AAU8JRH6_9ACTN